jgi:SSS family solute:Na+ symporter
MIAGTWLAWGPTSWVPIHTIFGTGIAAYNGLIALALNIAVAAALTAVLPDSAYDETSAHDYLDLPTEKAAV